MSLVDDIIPKPSDKDLVDALTLANNVLLSQGITSATDAGTNIVDIPTHFSAFKVAAEKGFLKVRHNLAIRSEVLIDYNDLNEELKNIEQKLLKMGIEPGLGSEKLRIGPFKFIPDGAISTATAATYEPYGADPNNLSTGELMISPEALTKVASVVHRLGFQLMIHGIGDRAIDAAINAIESVLQETPRRDPRPRIEHCVMVSPQMIRKIGELGILAVMQPSFLWGLGDNWISQLGRDRATKVQPFKTFLSNDVLMAFSSDRPVVNGAPLLGIHTAVNQKTMNGQDYAPEQKISVEEALRCYTLNGAYTTFEENIKGTIEEGKLADLVVLAEDLTKVSSERIKDIQVIATMVNGKFCYENWA
jgi:predicted amidohydrolase YtcJ